jgi:F420-dependent oxidoreductase-like protein
MRIGVALPAGELTDSKNIVTDLIEQTRQAASAGLDSVWFSQLFGHDAITLAALAGREVPGISVGTSVVPLYPRHPLLLGALAQTAQAATDGRFTLGVGLGWQGLLEPAYGIAYPPPIQYLRESLSVLRQVLEEDQAAFTGKLITARPPLSTAVAGGEEVPIVVAAMGPQALRIAGELADGTLPYLAGPRALAEHIVPTLTRAAEAAGRPAPRIIAGVPAVVTHDVEVTRQLAATHLDSYALIPSYRAMLDREGVAHPVELAAIGDENAVAAAIARYFDAGATEVVLMQSGIRSDSDRARTWQLAGSLTDR